MLILSPEAAGVGFTITEANNVIHLSRTWNPAKENQATDRIYRIGQTKVVNVCLPLAVSKNLRGKTFDENFDLLLSYKRDLSANVLLSTVATAADMNALAEMLKPPEEILEAAHWTIETVDGVTGLAFEQIICKLYNAMENFSAEVTPATNDYGADVVIESETNDELLIQCKHTATPDSAIGNKGVQEICAAVAHYEETYKRTFQPVVITNAKNFTANAIKLGKQNGVKLMARAELAELFRVHKILRC